jgi:hypothetical protein
MPAATILSRDREREHGGGGGVVFFEGWVVFIGLGEPELALRAGAAFVLIQEAGKPGFIIHQPVEAPGFAVRIEIQKSRPGSAG